MAAFGFFGTGWDRDGRGALFFVAPDFFFSKSSSINYMLYPVSSSLITHRQHPHRIVTHSQSFFLPVFFGSDMQICRLMLQGFPFEHNYSDDSWERNCLNVIKMNPNEGIGRPSSHVYIYIRNISSRTASTHRAFGLIYRAHTAKLPMTSWRDESRFNAEGWFGLDGGLPESLEKFDVTKGYYVHGRKAAHLVLLPDLLANCVLKPQQLAEAVPVSSFSGRHFFRTDIRSGPLQDLC